jgi:hypothetical protein
LGKVVSGRLVWGIKCEEEIFRFDVSVNDSSVMDGSEGVKHLV